VLGYEQKVRQGIIMSLLDSVEKGTTILDVGCGNARDIGVLVQHEFNCVGVDLSPSMINEGRRKLDRAHLQKVDLLVASATQLPFRSGSFNAIVCSEMLEHVPDYLDAVREIRRLTRIGGTVVVTTPNAVGVYGFFRMILRRIRALIGKPDPHPFDSWKSEAELNAALKSVGLGVLKNLGFCYLPGHPSYLLPPRAKTLLVELVSLIEPVLEHRLHRFGYEVAVKCTAIG